MGNYKFCRRNGGHLEFRHFEDLGAILEPGLQQICVQHPLLPIYSMYAINQHDLPSAS